MKENSFKIRQSHENRRHTTSREKRFPAREKGFSYIMEFSYGEDLSETTFSKYRLLLGVGMMKRFKLSRVFSQDDV